MSPDSSSKKTHRLVKNPTVPARYLAEFMDAGERRRRTIVRDCKYRGIGRIVQHKQAIATVSRYMREGGHTREWLLDRAEKLRNAIADDDFDRSVLDNNADYIAHFADVAGNASLPIAVVDPTAITDALEINGVKVNPQIRFLLSRVTKTNKVKIGAFALRYAKGKSTPQGVADWHTAFLFGYLGSTHDPNEATPEHKLCVLLDAHTGITHGAPTDATTRYNEMQASCATIAEWWDNIAPPANAVI